MRVVILNNQKEAIDYGSRHRENSDVVIPVGASARHYAIKNGWFFRYFGSLSTSSEYFEAKHASDEKIKKMIDELNIYSKNAAENFPLEIGNYFGFFLYGVIGTIHYNCFILDSIVRELKPEKWLIYVPGEEELFNDFWMGADSLLYQILMRTEYAALVEQSVCHSGNIKTKKQSLKQRIKKMVSVRTLSRLHQLKYLYNTRNCFINDKKRLLMVGGVFDWAPIFSTQEFIKNYYVHYFRGEVLEVSDNVPKIILDMFSHSVDYHGKPILDLSRQAAILQGTLLYFDRMVPRLLKKIEPYKAVLASIFVSPEQSFMAHLGSALNKPVITWQHGAMNLNDDPYTEVTETNYTSHYFCYAPGVAPKYEKYIGKTPMKGVFSVGSSKKRVEHKENRYILYATGKWMQTGVPFLNVIDPDTRLYDSQVKILTYLNTIGKDHEVIFKASNTEDANDVPFEYKNIVLEYQVPFTKLLESAKLVILDSPATTCIETCSTFVPLFVYPNRVSWYEEPMKLLKKRAVVADTLDELIRQIDVFLKNGSYSADPHNAEFFERYCGFKMSDDGVGVRHNVLSCLESVVGEEVKDAIDLERRSYVC